MKVILILVVLMIGAYFILHFTGSSIKEDFDPTQQGREAHAAIHPGDAWSQVVDKIGAPKKWKNEYSQYEFVLGYEDWDDTTPDTITKKVENGELASGFCFLYRYSDAATFAVNFNSQGAMVNIQDKESKADIQGE